MKRHFKTPLLKAYITSVAIGTIGTNGPENTITGGFVDTLIFTSSNENVNVMKVNEQCSTTNFDLFSEESV